MSNYTKTTDFEAKDSLPSGDSGKVIKGTEFETEFDNISTAIATKADLAGPTFTGTLTAAVLDISGNVDIDGTTNLDAVDVDGAVQIDGATTFGVNDTGVDVKFFGATSGAYLLWDESADKLLTAGSTVIDVVKDKLMIGGVAVTTTAAELNTLDGVTSTVTELNLLDGSSAGTIANSKGVIYGSSGEVNATTLQIAGSSITSSAAELNILDGKSFVDEDDMSSNSATAIASQQSIKAYVDSVTVPLTSFVLEDGDGTEVSISNGKEVKFVEGGGIDIDWTDTDNGTDGDPYDLTFQLANTVNIATKGTFGGASDGVEITQGAIALKNGGSVSTLDFYCESSNAHYTRLQSAPHASYAGNITLTLPASDGDSGQFLQTNGSGVMSWATAKQAGKETIWIPAAAMYPNTTAGCSALTQVELSNGPELKCLDFDDGSDEHAQFTVAFPKSWNLGTVTFRAYWCSSATDTDGVSWGLQACAMNDNETTNLAFGTAVVVDDANQGAANELCVTAESGAITIAGTPADEDLTFFQVFRDVSDANDTATEDARLLGIKLFFTTDAANDA
tara:strand:+ start:922 stop:2610 length:1689 start_codon:yes stop_codon:yes gene_type:complete